MDNGRGESQSKPEEPENLFLNYCRFPERYRRSPISQEDLLRLMLQNKYDVKAIKEMLPHLADRTKLEIINLWFQSRNFQQGQDVVEDKMAITANDIAQLMTAVPQESACNKIIQRWSSDYRSHPSFAEEFILFLELKNFPEERQDKMLSLIIPNPEEVTPLNEVAKPSNTTSIPTNHIVRLMQYVSKATISEFVDSWMEYEFRNGRDVSVDQMSHVLQCTDADQTKIAEVSSWIKLKFENKKNVFASEIEVLLPHIKEGKYQKIIVDRWRRVAKENDGVEEVSTKQHPGAATIPFAHNTMRQDIKNIKESEL